MKSTSRHLGRRAPAGRWLVAAVAGALVLAGCSSDKKSSTQDRSGSSASSETTATSSTATKAEPLLILVSNDDGYDAPGIDALVEGLAKVANSRVVVYAPLHQQSGTGGKHTDGQLQSAPVKRASGHEAVAVDGFPADTVRVAMDEAHIKPDVVITGINAGQNLGPVVDLSGTVGAARAAVARGVPALAVSSGAGKFDFTAAVPFVLTWIADHRAALEAHKAPVTVTNLNVPTCETGSIRGLIEAKPDLGGDVLQSLQPADCTSKAAVAAGAGDLAAFDAGYATISTVSSQPGG